MFPVKPDSKVPAVTHSLENNPSGSSSFNLFETPTSPKMRELHARHEATHIDDVSAQDHPEQTSLSRKEKSST